MLHAFELSVSCLVLPSLFSNALRNCCLRLSKVRIITGSCVSVIREDHFVSSLCVGRVIVGCKLSACYLQLQMIASLRMDLDQMQRQLNKSELEKHQLSIEREKVN